uniref:Uncharacterized protein n=1 Tax=Caenorhabditis japonica TaxID=281687 RepID=A0A8R1DRY0_CAEJA
MEVEEPVKKPPPPPPPVQTISSSSTITIASTPSTSPQKPAQTPSTSTATSSLSPSKSADVSNISAMVTKIFTTLMSKLKESKKKGVKTMDRVTIQEIRDLRRISAHHSINQDTLMKSFANTLGISYEEFKKQIFEHAKSDTMDWKLSASDLPHLGEADIAKMTTIVKSWKSKKQLPNTTLTAWLKDVNSTKMSVDQARVKLFEYVNGLPDVEKSRDAGVDLPKHERSRKARMFLHQWVYLSRKYVEMILPTLKRPTTDGYAAKQLEAVNALKDAVKKQVTLFAAKKDKFTDAVYQFQFTEPVLAAIWTYLDELIDYTLAIGNLEMLVKAIDTLYHQCLDTKITLIQFYVELCRRFQKLSFLTVEEPMKSRLIKAKEQIVKHQVVQNPKYMIKWPDGVEPSLRGFNKDLQITDFDTTILAKPKPAEPKTVATPTKPAPVLNKPAAPPAAKPPAVLKPAAAAAPLPKPPSTSNLPSTSTSKPTPTPLATRQPTEEERRAMNQVVQVSDPFAAALERLQQKQKQQQQQQQNQNLMRFNQKH